MAEVASNESKQSEASVDDTARFEESQKYVIRTLAALGLPLVLRSGQSFNMEPEAKKEIMAMLEDNERMFDEILKTGKPVILEEEYLSRAANFYHFVGNPAKAIATCEQILKRGPSKMAALNNKGVMLDADGQYENALLCFNEALSKVSENVHVLSNKGITLYKMERYQEALDCLEIALKVDASYVNALMFRAHSLYRLGKNAEALDGYNKVIRIDNGNAEALYNKACLCSLKGDEYGAITSLEKAVRLDPSWKEAASQDNDLSMVRNLPRFKNILK